MSSKAERDRRVRRVREEMVAGGHEVLLVIGRDGIWNRGYITYLTDWPMWGGLAYLIFPLEGRPTLVLGSHSMAYWARSVGWVEDVRVSIPSLVPETLNVLRSHGVKRQLGVAGMSRLLSYGDYQILTSGLPGVEFVDASEVLERVRAIKSPEEIHALTETCQIAAEAMARFRDVLAPGKTEREVVSEAWKVLREHGCLDGVAHIGQHDPPFIRPASERQIERNDIIKFSMEVAGPSGYCEELAAVFSFQAPPVEQLEVFNTVVKAVRVARLMLQPGVKSGDLVEAVEAAYIEDGWAPLHRVSWDAHGIGLDIIEPPILVKGGDVELEEGMAISLHPGLTYGERRLGFYLQDNHIVSLGGGRPLAGWPDIWTVLD